MKTFFTILFTLSIFLGLAQNSNNKIPTRRDSLEIEKLLVEGQRELVAENYEKALKVFQQVVEKDKMIATAHYKIGQLYLLNQDYSEAVFSLKKATSLSPKNIYFLKALATAYLKNNKIFEAEAIYKRILSIYPRDENVFYELINIYETIDNTQSLLNILEMMETNLGVKEDVMRRRTYILLQLGREEEVVDEYQKLINAYPNDVNFRFELIAFLMRTKRIDAASRAIEQCETLGFESPRLDLAKSELLWIKGERGRSLALLKEGFEKMKEGFELKFKILTNFISFTSETKYAQQISEISVLLADQNSKKFKAQALAADMLYFAKKPYQSIEYFEKAVSINPSSFSSWKNLINISLEEQNYKSVVKFSNDALEYFPNQAILYYFNGVGNQHLSKLPEAIQSLEYGTKFAIQDSQLLSLIYSTLGVLFYETEEYTRFSSSFDRALELQPNNPYTLNNFSYYLAQRKTDLEKAFEMSSELIKVFPNNAAYIDTHGWVLFAQGNYKEALKYIKSAVELEESGSLLEHYGDVLYQLGDTKNAINNWEAAAKVGGASELIDKKIEDKMLYEE